MTDGPVLEYGILYAGGSMLVRPPFDPVVDEHFPLATWIRSNQANGGHVLRRRIVIIEDWVELGRGVTA